MVVETPPLSPSVSPPKKDSEASSAAAGLRRRLGSLIPVQFYRLGELVVKLHLGLLESNQSLLVEKLRQQMVEFCGKTACLPV